MNSTQNTARMAGLLYLIFMLTFIFSSVVRSRIIVFGDAVATANNIMASERLFRIGFVSDILSAVFFLLAAWALYVLLKPVNKNLALLFLLLNLAGVVVESMNMLNLFAALLFLSGADNLKVFEMGQLKSFAMSFLNLSQSGFMIAQVFYGAWLFPLGYLVFKSNFLPKSLGILLMVDCVGILIWFFQFFLLPNYPAISYPSYAIGFIAELSLGLWLLVKGVQEQKPGLALTG
jgi:Domain of unknown function (DUF4386)